MAGRAFPTAPQTVDDCGAVARERQKLLEELVDVDAAQLQLQLQPLPGAKKRK